MSPSRILPLMFMGLILTAGSLTAQAPSADPGLSLPATLLPTIGETPTQSPAELPPMPSPEEAKILDKIGEHFQKQPENAEEETRMLQELQALFSEHRQKFPDSPRRYDVTTALVGVLIENGKKDEARAILVKEIESATEPPMRTRATLDLARFHMHLQEDDKAIEVMRAAFEKDKASPDATPIVYQLASSLNEKGDVDAAVATLKAHRDATKDPFNANQMHLRIIDLYIQRERFDDAFRELEALRQGKIEGPQLTMWSFFKAQAHVARGRTKPEPEAAKDFTEGQTLLEEVVTQTEKSPDQIQGLGLALSALADLHLYRGNVDKARETYKKMASAFEGKQEATYAARSLADLDWVGKQAPDFTAPSLKDKETVSLASMRGKVVLLYFWAMWCAPCMNDIPGMVDFKRELEGKPFEIVSCSLDPQEKRQELAEFVKRSAMDWTHVHDGKVWDSPVVATYKVSGVPSTYLIDGQGKILRVGLRGEHLKDVIKSTLAAQEKK